MPEPVVIIGPSPWPAMEPSAATIEQSHAETDADLAGAKTSDQAGADAEAHAEDSHAAVPTRFAIVATFLAWLTQIGNSLFRLSVRALFALAEILTRLAARYPRHSIAAVASLLILGGVWYSQRPLLDGGARRDNGEARPGDRLHSGECASLGQFASRHEGCG